jgi:UDP-galactose transporter B1
MSEEMYITTRRYVKDLIAQLPIISKNMKSPILNSSNAKGRKRFEIPSEVRLVLYVVSLYTIFLTWGYLQEKIVSTNYPVVSENSLIEMRWDYPVSLNLFVTISCTLTAAIVEHYFDENRKRVPFHLFWRAALASAMASPIGYFSLKYISFPMMILSKSSKHVPVMLIGKIVYKKEYEWYKYVSVAMICGGIALFTASKSGDKTENTSKPDNSSSTFGLLIGLFLIIFNLCLDGITCNEQDLLFSKHSSSSLEMMKNSNGWQSIYLSMYLLVNWLWQGSKSQLSSSLWMLMQSSLLRYDVFIFCLCACIGQTLLFSLIKEFGPLSWITVSVTRQLFTILLSVFLFQHHVGAWQWIGIACVFSGLGLEIVASHLQKKKGLAKKLSSDSLASDANESVETRDIENLHRTPRKAVKNE